MTMVGSNPPSASNQASMEVVVVLPCEPATRMPCFMRISSASISARGMTGMPFSRAALTSGLLGATALETTTTSASPRLAASWPRYTRPPSFSRRRVDSERTRSEPVTV